MTTIPFLDLASVHAELRAELDGAIARVLSSGMFLLGRELEAFEAQFARYTETVHAVGVGNGLDALVLALRALDVGPGAEVIVPANTFIATWLAVSHVGAVPVPVEPIPGEWNIDPDNVRRAITPRTRAIIPVHLYGQPCDIGALVSLGEEHGIPVIEDAAQAHGARYRGRRIGGHGALVCWSFYPGKNLGALGDGGAVTTADDGLAERVRVLRNYGSKVKYRHEVQGYNSRLDELQAAVLAVKLAHLDEWNERRRRIAAIYVDELSGCGDLKLPVVRSDVEHVWHLFVVDHPRRDELQAHLARRGIQTLIHYPVPPHQSEAYRSSHNASLPITEAAARTHLSLPMGPHLADSAAREVTRAVREFCG